MYLDGVGTGELHRLLEGLLPSSALITLESFLSFFFFFENCIILFLSFVVGLTGLDAYFL